MRAIDIASEQLEAARATRALVLAVNAENRFFAGIAAPRAPAIADELHLAIDLTKLSDELSRTYPQPGPQPGSAETGDLPH